MEILTYIQTRNNLPVCDSIDLISYAKEISNGAVVSAVVILSEFSKENFTGLRKYGIDNLYVIKSRFPDFDKRKYGALILQLFKKINPDIFILNSTTQGREIAPVVASGLNTGLTADCTKLEIKDNNLISTRPTYGGKLMASILCKSKPQMATLRTNTFKKKIFEENTTPLNIEEFEFEIQNPGTEILNFIKKEGGFSSLQNAKIILAGGMGLKNKESFDKLKYLAKLMNAKTGATRKAVDSGFIEREAQIGQTGEMVTPEIYIAFGIRGAIHHIMGMENSKKIISVNIDSKAPIFEISDIGIVDDAVKVIDMLILEFSSGKNLIW
ncbi:MAG: electron transfer flavoprotein subunit alpha/FixB family protein [Candidatus Gastranaerophilales bacterium]|nr:electron transfer flavoprotein subunit alpha/FixB family protein [Candidatus Gastranaerophilales bacterium]